MERKIIYLDDAIDALGEKPLAWTEGEYELGLQNQWQSDVDALNGLPSAQPEIIRCKECKHCKHWDGVDTCDVIDAPVWDNDFCSMAERRSNE